MPRKFDKKRSSRGGRPSQRKQKLHKRLQELYPGARPRDGNAEHETGDSDWGSVLEEGLARDDQNRSRGPRTRAKERPRPETGEVFQGAATITGLVVSIASGACCVEDAQRSLHNCVLPSRLAQRQASAIAIGDQVEIVAHNADLFRVRRVLPRTTTLSRPDPHNPQLERVIAANVDPVVQVASVRSPPLRPALVDRFLIAIERGGARPFLFINKIDLIRDRPDERAEVEESLRPYADLGVRVFFGSVLDGDGVELLREALVGTTAVLVGHSGVGKSSLLNALSPDLSLETQDVDRRAGKGRHTTTGSSLYHLEGGIRIIDTPGIRELGLWEMTLDQLAASFPELQHLAGGCRFSDCTHTHEPDCEVRRAVESGDIAAARYATYLRILESLG